MSNPNINVRQVAGEQVAIPDMENWTFGSISSLTDGQSSSSFLNLGSLTSLGAEEFTLEQTATYSGIDINNLTLDQFPLASEQTLSNLVLGTDNSQGVPYLDEYAIRDVPAIATLLQGNSQLGTVDLNQSLSEFSENNPLAEVKLNELGDLSQVRVSDIPNLSNTPFKDFPDWDGSLQQINPDATLVENIPGLENIPLSEFPNPLNINVNAIARIDTVRGEAEAKWERTVTGSDLVGFEFPCTEGELNTTACSHLELDDIENVGEAIKSPFEGKAWINGQYQWVEGGYGALKAFVFPGSTVAQPGLEPTGRLPFGEFAKLVLWEVDETTDSGEFVLFFRYCNALGCTPYNIGPVPFMTYKRNAMIPIGDFGNSGGSRSIATQPSNSLPIQTQQKLAQQKVLQENPIDSNVSSSGVDTNSVSQSLGDGIDTVKEVAGNISPETLADGAMSVLSKIQQDEAQQSSSSTVSPSQIPVTCIENNCGKTLGEYNLHSTHPKVVEAVSQNPGGEEFLENLRKPGHPTPTELKTFFPPAQQDAVMHDIVSEAATIANQQIDPTTEQLFCGGREAWRKPHRLVERTAQILAAGALSPIDSQTTNADGTLSVQEFGEDVQAYYSAHGGMAQCQ
ncbi:MAG: hypothetical protein WBA77_00535 [Microcoleaceae cyanobacterium]